MALRTRKDRRASPDSGPRRPPVLVLRRDVRELQHCVLAAARTLGRMGVPVLAVRQSETEPATRSRYVAGALDLPLAHSDEHWLGALMGLAPEFDGAVLLPIDDLAAVTVGDHQDTLATRFRLPIQPRGIQRRLASKLELTEVCAELGLPAPVSRLADSERQARSHAADLGYPVVLKRAAPWLQALDPTAPSVKVARSGEELEKAYRLMQSVDAPNVLIQEYIPGKSDSVWMFNGYFDEASTCLCAFTGQKLRQRLTGTGPATLGICVHNQTVVEHATRLMNRLGYRGIVDMGFRFDAREGRYKLLDVNPRLGSTFRLFVGSDGTDVVRAMYLDLGGDPVAYSTTHPGRMWLDEPHDLLAAWLQLRGRELSVRQWLQSLSGVSEAAWWASDDPVPFMAMAAGLPGLALLRSRTEARKRTTGTEADALVPR